jgi:hypothetical protein
MKNTQIVILTGILLLIGMIPAVSSFTTPDSIVVAGNVYVTSATYDPGTFFTGDAGTITVLVTNGNANQSTVVNHATIGDKDIRRMSHPYDTSANIGPLQTRPFTFSIATDAPEGTYYPTFSLSFRDADSLYYRAPVKVDNTPLELTTIEKPDTFAQGQKKTVNIRIANPRESSVRNVALDVSGDGITAAPARTYIGDLAAGTSVPVNFTITPDQPTTVHLTVNYDNGDNPHVATMDIPITFGIDKTQANPVMCNVQVTSAAGIYHVTGDVNNAGLQTAFTVMVTSLSPAVPQDPYKSYVVGALKSDDFGSFEVTFSAQNATVVPIQLSFKDADGNVYNSVKEVKISAAGPGASSATNGSSNMLPVIAAVIVLVVFIAGWALYLRRKK